MITLHGAAMSKGIAIAEAAILPPSGGIADLPHVLLERGLAAIKRRSPESEMPEIVVLCESAVDGFALNLPGIKIAAVAAESGNGMIDTCSVPCVAELRDLLRDANNGDIVIVDGIRGVVYLDPDADTLIQYQSMADSHKTRRIFLESRHLPATTQEGKLISVLALANCVIDVPSSLEEGADGIVLPRNVVDGMTASNWEQYITLAAGKPLVLLSAPGVECVRAIISQSLPGQITVCFPCTEQQDAARFLADVDAVSAELLDEGAEPAIPTITLSIGERDDVSCSDSPARPYRLIVDAGGCDFTATHNELRRCVINALSMKSPAGAGTIPTTIILGSSIDAVSHLPVEVDSVAVPVGLVGVTKDLVRSFPLDAQF